MIKTMRPAAGVVFAVCLSVGVVRAAHAPGTNLYINGGLASNRMIERNGIAYVPVADVAKALNQTVVPQSDGLALSTAGGANQVSGTNGKVGDKLTNGQVTVTVVKAFRTDHYVKQFDTGDVTPNRPTDDLVVVVLHVKNATPKSTTLEILNGANTALTDQDEHSYTPGRSNADFRSDSPTLLPGSAYDFAYVFSVPKTEKIGDFVYQVDAGGGPIDMKSTNFRISMASLNP